MNMNIKNVEDIFPDIALEMIENTRVAQKGFIDAGYSYIGQMLSHDIAPETTRTELSREVTGKLELDSLYGNVRPDGYSDTMFDEQGKFILNNDFDLFRDETGKAIIPESRNDENIIIAQLHSFWQRFHNYLIDKEYACGLAEARRITTLTFQLIVVEDFLREILNEEIFEKCVVKNQRHPGIDDPELAKTIFRNASFRFGHSMIRGSYVLHNKDNGTDLDVLFQGNKNTRTISEEHKINWSRFFSTPGFLEAQKAFGIDTRMSSSMGKIPCETCDDPFINIISKNLIAGQNANLGSGYALAKQLAEQSDISINILDNENINNASFVKTWKKFTTEENLIKDLPLWLYVLLEAQENGNKAKLGELGGILNAQVLRVAIKEAQHSIFKDDEYQFDTVIDSLGGFGEMLDKRFLLTNNPNNKTKRIRMAHLVGLLFDNKEDKKMSKNYKELDHWVFDKDIHDDDRTVIWIDYFNDDLDEYMPGSIGRHGIKLMKNSDGQTARVELTSGPWSEKILKVASNLKLKLEIPDDEIEGEPVLIDMNVDNGDVEFNKGWKIGAWMIIIRKKSGGESERFEEIIFWTREGESTVTRWGWIPY